MKSARLFVLIGLLFASLGARAEPWHLVPTRVDSIMVPRTADAWHAAQERVARQRGIDVAFLHGGAGGAGGSSGGSTCPATGTQYFVSSSLGNDAFDGLGPTNTGGTHGPFASVAKVNSPGFNFGPNQCVSFKGGDTFTGCLVFKTGTNVAGSLASAPMYVGVYGTGNATINSNCPGSQTAAFTIDGVSGIVVGGMAQTFNVEANGTMTQYGYLLINSQSAQSGPVTVYLGDVSGFWTNINQNGSTAAEVYYSGGYGPGGINGINLIGAPGNLHGATVTSNDDGGIVSNNSNQNILNVSITGVDVYNLGSLPGGCNGQSNCPGRGEGILVDGTNGAKLSFFRIHDIGANVNAPGGGPSGLECYASNNVLAEWYEIYNVRPLNGVYPGQGDDWDGDDMDGGCTNSTWQFKYTHNNGGAGHLNWMGAVGSFGWGGNIHRFYISENDNTLGAQIGGGFASVTFSGEGLASAIVADYNGTIYQGNAGTAALGFVGSNSNPTAGSIIANEAIVTGSNSVPIQCLNYAGGNLSLSQIAFKSNGYSGNAFSAQNCNSGTVNTLAAWQAAATGGDAGAVTASPNFTGTPPFGSLTWTPSTQTGTLPGPAGYVPGNAAYVGTGFNLAAAPYNQTLPAADYAGVSLASGLPIGAVVAPPSAPASIQSVVCNPGTGLLTATGGSNTLACSITFSAAVTAGPSNVLKMSNGVACPITPATGLTLTANCTFTSGTDTPTKGTRLSLSTLASGAISGGTISNGAGVASLTNANGVYFAGLKVQTHPYFVTNAGTGSDSNPGTVAQPFATLAKCQSAMQGGLTKACYAAGGTTYNPASTTTFAAPYQGGCSGTGCNIVTVALGLGFGGSTTDNGELWTYYPCAPMPACGPHINLSGIGEFMRLGNGGNGTPTSVVVEGLTFTGATYEGIGMDGAGAVDLWNNTCGGLTNALAASGPDGNACFGPLDNYWNTTTISHNLVTDATGAAISGPSNLPSGNYGQGPIIIDSNKVKGCSAGGDCGIIYGGYDQSYSTCGAGGEQITNNNIVGGAVGESTFIYLDDSESCVTATGNVMTGIAYVAIHLHGGGTDLLNLNLIDMSGIWPGNPNATIMYYQASNAFNSFGVIKGYGGNMGGNQFQKNVINTTHMETLGFIHVQEQDPGQNVSGGGCILPPADTGNDYWWTGGAWPTVSSSSGCGGFTDTSPSFTNPGVTYTNDSDGFPHPAFSGPLPAGFAISATPGPLY